MLLCGCLHTAASPETSAQTMTPIYTERLPMTVKFLEFSANGKTFVVGGEYWFVNLYDSLTYKNLATFTKENTDYLEQGSVQGTGYIDNNTWYFAAGRDVITVIRQIDPPREIFRQVFEHGSDKGVGVNKNHIAYRDTLLNWHDSSSYKVENAHSARFGYALTAGSRVLSYNAFNGDILLDDPIGEDTLYWNAGFPITSLALSRDEKYAVALSHKGKCAAWRLPEKKRIGSCGSKLALTDKSVQSVFQRDGRLFAVSVGNEIQVYRTEPYQLILSVAMLKPVMALALGENRLAASDEDGMMRIWSIDDASLIGQYAHDPALTSFTNRLDFQPNGSLLAATQGGQLMLFDLETRPSDQ